MTAGKARKSRPSILLLGVCLIAGFVVYMELNADPDFRAAGVPAAPPSEAVPLAQTAPDFAMPSLDDFSEIVERPLFLDTRRPPEPTEEPPKVRPGVKRNLFALRGVIITAADRVALIEHLRSRELIRASEGQIIYDWRVHSILRDRVILRQAGATEEIKLEDSPESRGPKRRKRKKRAEKSAESAESAESTEESTE